MREHQAEELARREGAEVAARAGGARRAVADGEPDPGARQQLTQAREALDRMLGDPSWRGELTLRQVMALLWALQWMQFVVDFAADARCDLEMAGDVVAASWWR